jgi:hypothetical protein
MKLFGKIEIKRGEIFKKITNVIGNKFNKLTVNVQLFPPNISQISQFAKIVYSIKRLSSALYTRYT